MKPNLRTFIDYVKKYPEKRICMRTLYKDYSVDKKERDKWRQAFDLVVENLNARDVTQEAETPSEKEGVKGKT